MRWKGSAADGLAISKMHSEAKASQQTENLAGNIVFG